MKNLNAISNYKKIQKNLTVSVIINNIYIHINNIYIHIYTYNIYLIFLENILVTITRASSMLL